jgi:DNA polymerase III alpha subunit
MGIRRLGVAMTIENNILRVPPDTTLEDLAVEGLKKRVTTILAIYPERNTEQQAYRDRLYSELKIIKQAQLSGHFLFLSDIVIWARNIGTPVSPGGAILGSLVAYAIGVTYIDPMRYNLLFERCLISERSVMPSIDIDFCEGHDEVIQYIKERSGGDIDCNGCRLRIHPPVKHFHAVSYAEATSPVKLNFHGNKALAVNNKAVQLIRTGKSPDFNLADLRDDEPATLELFVSGKTKDIFLFESIAMRNFLKRLKPTSFEDLIAANTLFRPVPIAYGMANAVVNRKHGHIKIVYELPQLEPILKDTYGVIIYQEHFMAIMHTIAGYCLGEADLLRREMIKMDKEKHFTRKGQFLAGAQKQGISEETASTIFHRMIPFGEHYFMKAHATAHVMLSYQSAYLKVHYPEEFETALRSHPNSDRCSLGPHHD